MSARSGAHVLSTINSTLISNGLTWIGVATGVSLNNTNPSRIESGIGSGPRERIHLKRDLIVEMNVSSLIPKSVSESAESLDFMQPTFDNYQYYYGLLDPASQILLHQPNKAIMTAYSVNLSPGDAIRGTFSHNILQPDDTIKDLIEEYETAAEIPTGTGSEVQVFDNGELPVIFNEQFFPGCFNVGISSSAQLNALVSPGGIYGYYYGKPFGVTVNITTYEKDFEVYQQFFSDVNNLADMRVGPFTVENVKMQTHVPSVEADGFKRVTVELLGTNFKYTPSV